jgi:hypothetical protein
MNGARRLSRLVLAAALLAGCNDQVGPWTPVPRPDKAHTPPPSGSDLLVGNRVSARPSTIIVHGVAGGVFAALFLTALGLALVHRRRARAEASFDPRAPLRDGDAVIFGEVELVPDHEGPAALVRLEQIGTEQRNKNGGYSHYWREVRREVRARPFYVRRDDGTRVLVEPDPRVALHDDLSRIEREGPAIRARIAELTAGERVHVTGQLRWASGGAPQAVYRDAGGGPVLRAPRFGRMVISTERPGDTEAERMRFHRGWAIALAIVFWIVNGLVIPTYQILAIDGQVVRAKLTHTRVWKVWHKPKNSSGYWVQHYDVRARRASGGEPLEDECSAMLHLCASAGRCTEAPFVVASHAPSIHQVGSGPTITEGQMAMIIITLVLLLIIYPASTVATRPWYQRSKMTDYGSGRLAASTP